MKLTKIKNLDHYICKDIAAYYISYTEQTKIKKLDPCICKDIAA